jgi:hypothetical protein
MKYYSVYDSNTNDFLGMLSFEIDIHSEAESVNVPIITKGAVYEKSEEAQKMWDKLIENKLLPYGDRINLEIRKILPPPKRNSFFPPRYLVIDLSKYDDDFEKYLRFFLEVYTPNQPEIKE